MIYMDTPFIVDPQIYPDAPHVFRNNVSAHLTADTVEELVEYAELIGLKRHWLQDAKDWRFHFDVTGVFLRKVLADARVQKLSKREFAQILIDRRQKFLSSRYPQLSRHKSDPQ